MERCPAEGAARRPSPVRVVLVVGLSLLGVFCLLPYSVWRDGVYDTAALFSVGAMVWALRRYRPRRAGPWWLLVGSTALFCAGDVLYDVLSHGFGIDAFPSVVDVFFLASRTATPAARWLAAAFTIELAADLVYVRLALDHSYVAGSPSASTCPPGSCGNPASSPTSRRPSTPPGWRRNASSWRSPNPCCSTTSTPPSRRSDSSGNSA